MSALHSNMITKLCTNIAQSFTQVNRHIHKYVEFRFITPMLYKNKFVEIKQHCCIFWTECTRVMPG